MIPDFKLPLVKSYEEFELLKPDENLWKMAAQEIIRRHKLPTQSLKLFPDGSNIVFAHGPDQVIKIFVPVLKAQFESEKLVLNQIYGKISVLIPKIEYVGELDGGWPYIVMSRLEGQTLERLWETLPFENKLILIRELGDLIRQMHSVSTQGMEAIDSHWDTFLENQIKNCVERHRSSKLPEALVQAIPDYLELAQSLLPKKIQPVLLTGEYTPMNLIVRQNQGSWHIHGLIDFGDSMLGSHEYDFLGPGAFLIQGDKQLARALLISYGYSEESLNSSLSKKLTALTLLHKYSNLNIQIRITSWQSRIKTLEDLENLIWSF